MARDREIIEALEALVDSYPRRGFWKYYKMLRREGLSLKTTSGCTGCIAVSKLNHRRRAKRRVPVREP